jgi:molybdate transport system substrate-binding protein
MSIKKFFSLIRIFTVSFLGVSSTAQSAEIDVLAIVIFKSAMPALVEAFELRSGHTVKATVMNPLALQTRYVDGEPVDLVLTLTPTIDSFVAKGVALASGRRTVARSGIGVAVTQGFPKPEVGTTLALTSALRAANNIGFSAGPSGAYVEKMLSQLAIENIGGKKFVKITLEPVAAPLSRGELTIGLQQLSELLGQPGIDVIGRLPSDLQHYTVVDAALHPRGKNVSAAIAFADFLNSADALAIMRKAGIDGPQ